MPLPIANIPTPPGPAVRSGLLDVAVGPAPLPPHSDHGAQYEAAACTSGRLYPVACQEPPYPAITYDAREAMNTAYAFNVYASEVCTPVGTSMREAEQRVRERLRIGEQAAVEQALWGGAAGVTGVFEALQAAGKVTTIPAGPDGPVNALAKLEQTAYAAYDGPVLIHARPFMAPWLAKNNLLDPRKPSTLPDFHRTHNGSIVNFGAGYSGNTAAGVAPSATTETIYATGRIFVWRSDVFVPTDPNQLLSIQNQRSMYAMRTYAIAVECIAAAIEVTRAS